MQFVQGLDYGRRKGTLGWNIHMAEGGDGTVAFLAQRQGETRAEWIRRVRGVSASFVIKTDGTPVQMVDWDNAAGNLNPDDRSTDKAFYGRRYLLEVLGTHWTDPNAWTLSMEICGFRAQGPTQAQVDTAVALVEESRARYPGIVGAFSHADQTDTKGCPGTAPLMRQLWDRVGHGTFRDLAGGDVAVVGAGNGKTKPWTGYEVLMGDGRDFFNDGQLTDRRGEAHGNQMCPYGGPVQDGADGARMICIPTATGYADKVTRWTWVYARPSGEPVKVEAPGEPPLPVAATVLTPGLYEVKE